MPKGPNLWTHGRERYLALCSAGLAKRCEVRSCRGKCGGKLLRPVGSSTDIDVCPFCAQVDETSGKDAPVVHLATNPGELFPDSPPPSDQLATKQRERSRGHIQAAIAKIDQASPRKDI